jgi:hypothetical protein
MREYKDLKRSIKNNDIKAVTKSQDQTDELLNSKTFKKN